MDFFGDPFAEKQMQAATHDHDGSLRLQWPLYFSALAAGDRFSVCSTSQAHAMTGQLAFAGRLNGATDGERLVHVLKPSSRAMLELEKRQGPQVRPVSLTVPTEAFKVLWTGGYNTWADVDTLFAGLEMAMSRNSRIHFVSTGGAIAGHDNRTANRFQALIANSEHRDRYHFLGWVQTRDIPYIYRLADVAVNVDRPCYEGELGTRNRLIDWMLFEVPIVTTVSCDLARELGERGLVNAVNCGDGAGLAEALDQVAADPSAAKARAKFAKDWFEQAHQESQSFQPLLTWAANPVRAGDQPTDSPNSPPTVVSHPLGAVGEVKSLLSQRHLRALAGPQRKSLIRRVLGRLLGR
jgi:glycosyltransferase involved in cell wall biosynthesis